MREADADVQSMSRQFHAGPVHQRERSEIPGVCQLRCRAGDGLTGGGSAALRRCDHARPLHRCRPPALALVLAHHRMVPVGVPVQRHTAVGQRQPGRAHPRHSVHPRQVLPQGPQSQGRNAPFDSMNPLELTKQRIKSLK